MQVYVHKDDQQYGPYTVEQLREYVQQGDFLTGDHACHDGQNWVTIAQVPGFAEATQPAVMQDPPSPQQEQAVHEPMSIVFNVLVGLGVVATAGGVWGLLPLPGTAIILGFALSAAGIFCSASHEKQWGVLGMMLMLVGTITAAISIIFLTDNFRVEDDPEGRPHVLWGVTGYLIVTVLFLVVSVLGKSGALAGLAALSIFPAFLSTLDMEFEYKLIPTVTIILFAALSLGAYHLSKVFASDYKRLAIIFSRTSLLVVNVGFCIGSVGDTVRDSLLFLTAWAVALLGTGLWAAKNNKRWVVNLSVVFGIIAILSQLFAGDILDWDDDMWFLIIAPVIFLVVSVLRKSGALASLAALAISPAMWPMVRDDEHIPTVTIILFAALSLGAYHWSKALASDYKRLAIIFSRTSLFVINVGFLIGSFSDHGRLVFVIAWGVALLGTGVWAAKNDKRWVVNLSAFFGIIAIFSQLYSFEFQPLSILIVGLTSLGLAFALVRYNKHAPGPANLKKARTPAKSYESMPARVKTAEVPGFVDAGDSVTTTQQDQAVHEHAVEQQPASADASSPPSMQAYVSKDGQQYGPYTIEQLREYVHQGDFLTGDHACFDGQNWVTIAEVPEFADAGDSVTTPQQDQAVQEHAVEQQSASADASSPPANKKKIILWSSIGGIATLLVAGLLIWILFGDEDSGPESNPSSAAPPGSKITRVSKIDLDDPKTRKKIIAKAPKVVHPSKLKWRKGLAYFKGGPFTGIIVKKYPNGQKSVESTWKDGKKVGLSTSWYENGQKKSERIWKDGKEIPGKPWARVISRKDWDEEGNQTK